MTYLGTRALDPTETYTVIYEVQGPEDGPEIASFEISGDEYSFESDSVSTPSSETQLTATVTSVR